MADEIKQKISLEGEKEYSAALREANRNLKTLRSELKAETAELGNNASAQQKNETKSRSLRKQIEQQEKVVSTLKSALKEAKERYGDNSAEVAKWEQKLNGARYTLASMNNDLEASERALKEQQDALKDSADSYDDAANAASDYADAVGDAGATADAVTFQGIMTAADNLTGKLKSALDFIVNLGKASWEWMSDSGEWADTLTTEAQNYGVSRETLQGWRYAARFVDTEVETIGNAFNKLTNRSDAVNKKLEEIGIVADKGVKGQDLFWPVIEAIGRLDDAAKENAAMDIFGKSFRDLLPLINAGQEAWEGYVKEAEESGYVLSEEQVDKLGAFDDANQKLQASFEAMQHTIAAELAPAFTEVSKAMSGLIDSFTEWAKTEEGQKTLHDLGDALKGLVDTITGEQNFKGLVDGAAEAVKGLTDALGWISEHWEEVKNGLGFIGAAMGALTIGKDVLSALMLIKGIKWFGGGGGGKGGITDTVTATAGGGPIAAAGNFLTGITSKAASFIGQGGMLFQGGVLGDWFTNQTNAGRALRDGMDVIDGLTQDINEAKDTISKNASTFAEDWKGVGENILELPFMQKARANGENTIRFWDQFYKNIGSGVKGFWDQLTMAGQNRRGSEQAIEVAAGEEGDALGQAFVNYVKANQELQDIFNGNAEYSDERANELVEQVEAARELFQGMEGSEDVMKAYSDWLQENSYGSDSWKLPDEIPAGWFSDVLDSMTWENSGTLTSDDVSGFAALPGSIEEAVANGIASGTSGMSITMDGVTVGRVVAPYVSQELAFGIP